MKYTNIYLEFLKIKNDKQIQNNIKELEGLAKKSDADKNKQIKEFMKKVYEEGRKKRIVELLTVKGLGYSQYLVMIEYLTYNFLYVEYEDWCICINYEIEGAKICKTGHHQLWEYIPYMQENADKYRYVQGAGCYIVNTYDAYVHYVQDCGEGYLSRSYNNDFYADVEVMFLSNLPNYFYSENNQLYLRERVPEGIQTFYLQKEQHSLSFTILFIDNMVIIAECSCICNFTNATISQVNEK